LPCGSVGSLGWCDGRWIHSQQRASCLVQGCLRTTHRSAPYARFCLPSVCSEIAGLYAPYREHQLGGPCLEARSGGVPSFCVSHELTLAKRLVTPNVLSPNPKSCHERYQTPRVGRLTLDHPSHVRQLPNYRIDLGYILTRNSRSPFIRANLVHHGTMALYLPESRRTLAKLSPSPRVLGHAADRK
jgi:hypothetical protein